MPAPNLSTHELISASLMYFQLIELAIKEYFKLLSEIITEKLKDIIPSDFQFYRDRDTLGTLVDIFKKLNNNTELIKELDKIVEDRNIIAHRIHLNYMDSFSKAAIKSKGQDQAILNQAINEAWAGHFSALEAILSRAKNGLFSLAEEQKKIRAKGKGETRL